MKIVILGGGPAGYVGAIKAAQLGADVTVVEDTEVGGTCLNRGCIPTKTIIASVEVLNKVKNSSDYGIEIKGEIYPDINKIIERKNKVVSTQVKGIRALFKSWGVKLVQGKGRLLSHDKVEIEKFDGTKEILDANRIIIATGSRPAQITSFPSDGERILSSTDILNIKEIPKSLLIIGAGVIGCEFACIFSELGTEITMVEMLPRALSTEDVEVSELLERELKKKKIKLITNVSVDRVEKTLGGVNTYLSDGREIVTEKVLVSIGRSFNTEDIGPDKIGIQRGPHGEIIVNERMETNIRGVYAAGDVTGGILLAHVAAREGIVAAINACGGSARMDYSVVPSAIFTSPEIASVGLREQEALERGIKIKTGHFRFRSLGKAHAMGEITGFIKIIADADNDRVLGAHIIGPHASDLIHEAVLAIKTGLKVQDISMTIHAHPTLAEGLMEASDDVFGEAIHVPR